MKKITFLCIMTGLMFSTTTLLAQTYFACSMNDGATVQSSPGSFPGYAWGTPGVPGFSFNNATSKGISLAITNYDENNPSVGPELFVTFSRVGFGKAPLGWGSDNATTLATLKASDFTNGAATILVDIPVGTVPVAETADYVSGYHYILQISGANPADDQNYINYAVNIDEQILSTKNVAKQAFSFYPNPVKTEINLNTNQSFERFQIIDVTGKVIKKGAFSKVINIEDLQKGVYFLGLDNYYQKFIKN
ncbi:T9SS type A sorting domain-containing protein [Algibacter mikhailovii]|uniref:T9SS type A sorting domain-containing protein n=1 Tax=Algibacter mikhailovii TaxID=425498 RepID=UPI002494CF6E|nr:T9SS type A sorting domain-containing protein [Algibacter mikhailovii]